MPGAGLAPACRGSRRRSGDLRPASCRHEQPAIFVIGQIAGAVEAAFESRLRHRWPNARDNPCRPSICPSFRTASIWANAGR
jgi:hypothetical protein